MNDNSLDVLLVNPPSGSAGYTKSPWRYVLSSNVSYGLLSLSSYLTKHGMNAAIIDSSAHSYTNAETLEIVKRYDPACIAFSATTTSISNAAYLCSRIKELNPEIITIIGGSHVSSIPERTMQLFKSFDIAVLNEGELTLSELLKRLKSSRSDLSDIKGIIFRENSKLIRTAPRQFIENLSDTLPLPDWSILPDFPKAYQPPIFFSPSSRVATLVTSRGCPYSCNFCNKSVFGNNYRSFTAEYIIECIKILSRDYNINYFLFYDDNFTVDKQRLTNICDLIIKSNLNISFSCDAHVNTLTPEIIILLKRAGCWSISFGLESGSRKILESFGKTSDLEKARDIVNLTHSNGIRTKGLFILGSPEETLGTIDETIDFIKNLKLSTINLSKFAPYPGTKYYDMLQHDNEIELWDTLNGTTFTDINKNIPLDILEKEYYRVLKYFYNNKHVFAEHLGYILGSSNNVLRLSKSFACKIAHC